MKKNLLVVDWDYFFHEESDKHPYMYDWGHRESPLFIEGLWQFRAAGFLAKKVRLPRLTGLQRGFWGRFAFARGARAFAAESNVVAASPAVIGATRRQRRSWDSVWLFDAHHDAGYKDAEDIIASPTLDCGDWAAAYLLANRELVHHVRYPTWKHWAFKAEPDTGLDALCADRIDRSFDVPEARPSASDVVFTRVFVCRSGAWVPPWHDGDFFRFLADCPLPVTLADDLGHRPWSWREARADAHKIRLIDSGALERALAKKKEEART